MSKILTGILVLFLAAPLAAQQRTDTATAADAAEEQSSRIDIGGYGSFRLDGSDAGEDDPSFTLRRFVVTTDAHLGERFQVYSEIELERLSEIEVEREAKRTDGGVRFEQELEGTNGSEIALEQAWVQWNFTPEIGVRFGAVLPPVGRFNLLHDDDLWNLPRRPLVDREAQVLPASAAWTEMGLGVVGTTFLDSGVRLAWQAYLLNGVTLDFAIEEIVQTRDPSRDKLELEAVVRPRSGAFDGSNTADAVAARFEVSPALGSEFAISGYLGRYTPDFLDDVDESITTLGLDGRQQLGGFVLEGEFLYTRYGGVDEVLASFARAVGEQASETTSEETANLEAEIETELTGLADRRYGFWADLTRPIPLRPGTLGLADATLIPVLRYERVWLDDDLQELDFTGGVITEAIRADRSQDRLSVGFALRPIPQAVIQLVYERSHAYDGALIAPASDDDTVNGFALGMAVGF
ncbi:hypothetical protein BH20GEM2_BH20GEM2_05910 [soil metagenome]